MTNFKLSNASLKLNKALEHNARKKSVSDRCFSCERDYAYSSKMVILHFVIIFFKVKQMCVLQRIDAFISSEDLLILTLCEHTEFLFPFCGEPAII